jgi:uncharacterized protein
MPGPETAHAWLDANPTSCVLRLKVLPGAKRTKVIGPYGDQLKIAIAAPPVDGRANTVLLGWLADALGIARSSITLISGQTSRLKRVGIHGVSRGKIAAILLGLDSSDHP